MPSKWYPKVLLGTVAGWVAPVTSVALARSVYDPGLGVSQRNSHRCQAAGALGPPRGGPVPARRSGDRGRAGCRVPERGFGFCLGCEMYLLIS